MKKISLALSVIALTMAASNAIAGTSVNVNINGYLPAPPGVQVVLAGGRPCYREDGRVVYLERDKRHPKHRRGHSYGHREHSSDHDGRGQHDRHA
jgi:hypothetical protein